MVRAHAVLQPRRLPETSQLRDTSLCVTKYSRFVQPVSFGVSLQSPQQLMPYPSLAHSCWLALMSRASHLRTFTLASCRITIFSCLAPYVVPGNGCITCTSLHCLHSGGMYHCKARSRPLLLPDGGCSWAPQPGQENGRQCQRSPAGSAAGRRRSLSGAPFPSFHMICESYMSSFCTGHSACCADASSSWV